MEHHTTTSRAEAERLLGIAEKLLGNKDFAACRDFAILAQETEPLLEGSDQILAIAEVLLAGDNSSNKLSNNRPDWYAILQLGQRTDDVELIKKKYRHLALLLHPDKNKFPFSDSAFHLVADSWAVLSDPAKKAAYDSEAVSRFTKVDLAASKRQQQKFNQRMKQKTKDASEPKLPVRRSSRGQGEDGDGDARSTETRGRKKNSAPSTESMQNFWTTCPYCYNLYEYQKTYEGCCLRCQSCKRAFTATEILSMPPVVPGKEAYYCCWGFFPMSFTTGNAKGQDGGFPKWMPPIYGSAPPPAEAEVLPSRTPPPQNVTPISAAAPAVAQPPPVAGTAEKRKRGRPRKNP